MIAIIDYGMGNLRSVQKAFEHVGSPAIITSAADDVRRAEKVVLPGVGAFADAMTHLRERGLVDAVVEAARSGRPFLGICLGLQLLFEVGYEDGEHPGLGIFPGKVVHFDWTGQPQAAGLKIPHMGWNQVRWARPTPFNAGVADGRHFYFVHSYYAVPADESLVLGWCDYGYPFAAAIARDKVFAAQFHPEKSQADGLTLLRNFAAL